MSTLLNSLMGKTLQESRKIEESKKKYEILPEGNELPSQFIKNVDDRKRLVAWFHNKQNALGWWIVTIDEFDADWLSQKGVDLKNVFRSHTDRGHTNIIRINPVSGTYAFVDNGHLEKTDEVKFEKAVKYTMLRINNNKMALNAFGVSSV